MHSRASLLSSARRALVLAALAPGLAAAQTGNGSALVESGIEYTHELDPNGMSVLRETRRRSPSGLLYAFPYELWDYTELANGLLYRGYLEAGYLGSAGDTDEARFEEYVDWRSGFALPYFSTNLRKPETGFFADISGGSVGRKDQFYRGQGGRFGLFRLSAFYDSLPHRYANDAHDLFDGVGSEFLSLPAPLVAGGNTVDEIRAAVDAAGQRSLGLRLRAGGARAELVPGAGVKLFADYGILEREGTRPFGGAIFPAFTGSPQGSAVESVAPVDERTHNISAGVEYAADWAQGNLSYNGSFFRNDFDTLGWENPFALPFPVDEGLLALAPDNAWHNVKGDVAFELPLAGRLTATASWSRMEQDERLLAPTVNPDPFYSDWIDPSTALSQDSADAEVDTFLANAKLRLRPWRPLVLRAGFRYFERDSNTDYEAFNPTLDVFAYVPEDGSLGAQPRYKAIPFGYKKWNIDASASWRTSFRTTLLVEYEREIVERDHAQVSTTRENRVEVSATSRGVPWATARLVYSYGDREASPDDKARNASFYSDGPPDFDLPSQGTPARSLAELRNFDLAGRSQHVVNARVNFLINEAVDLALAGGFRTDDFDADYGVREARSGNANLELGYRPSPELDLFAWGSYEAASSKLRSITPVPIFSTDPADFVAGGAAFPLANTWSLDSDVASVGVGAGLRYRLLRRYTFQIDYAFQHSNEKLDYDFASTGSLTPGVDPAQVGSSFPDLENSDHVLQASLRAAWTESFSTRLTYRFEYSTIDDFHQTDLEPLLGNFQALYLGHVERNATTHVYGATVSYRF